MRFSIITVCYNSSSTIERTIKSVLSQAFCDFEYIIIDGSSTDGTLEIIKSYESLFNGRLTWLSEPDTGIFNAMNKGIKRAKGDIIGIVNSDDWLEEDTLNTIQKSYEQTMTMKDNSLYCGAIRYHYSNYYQDMFPNLGMAYQSRKRLLLKGIWHPATFVPRKVYEKIGLFDEQFKIMADSDFIFRCYKSGINFVAVSAILNNMSTGGASCSVKSYYKDYDKLLKKYHYSGWNYIWRYYKEVLVVALRRILPSRLIKLYRSTY